MATFNLIDGFEFPTWHSRLIGNPATSSTTALTATGHKTAISGRVWNKDRAQKSIRKVGFKFGLVTKTGGSGLTVSLQNILSSTGPAFRPDEIQDQTWAIANGDTSFANNLFYLTGNLSADRLVDYGEFIACVIEYDVNGRLASDSVAVQGVANTVAVGETTAGLTPKSGASWGTNSTILPILLLGFSDGTWGSLMGGYVTSAQSWQTVMTLGGSPEESGAKFVPRWNCKCDGAWFMTTIGLGANARAILYDAGGMEITSKTIDGNATSSAGSVKKLSVAWTPVELVADQMYRIVLKAEHAANTVAVYGHDVLAAEHLTGMPGGSDFIFCSRTAGMGWTDVATRKPFMAITLSHMEIGSAAPPEPEDWKGGPLTGRLIK